MNSGFDMVGNTRKLRLLRQEEKDKKNGKPGDEKKLPPPPDHLKYEAEAKMDGSTHFIKNIVYARDPSIIDRETMHVN